jgi:hypothetical protein
MSNQTRRKLGNLLAVEVAEDRLLDEGSVGERERLEGLSVRGRDVGAGDALGGGVEEVKRGRLADLGNDLRADTEGREASLDSNKVVGLLDRRVDSVNVKRADRAVRC